jgi:hypothetical protein
MMLLQIMRSEPDETVQSLIREVSKDNESQEVSLYEGAVDYDKLIQDIFVSDQVICWW